MFRLLFWTAALVLALHVGHHSFPAVPAFGFFASLGIVGSVGLLRVLWRRRAQRYRPIVVNGRY